MSPDPEYTFAVRALRRWREERLTLTPRDGGGWRARFHFDGSTCGNVAFVLHYDIEVDGSGRIVGMRAAAAPGDEGHESLCRHREDAASLRAELATPGPLHGRPLADVLAWRPATSPAGCVCSAPARAHKWLAALQTLHFALHAPPAGRAAARAATEAGASGVGTRPAGAAVATAASSSTSMPEPASASAAHRDTPPSSSPPTSLS